MSDGVDGMLLGRASSEWDCMVVAGNRISCRLPIRTCLRGICI